MATINRRLLPILTELNLLPDTQFGFTPGVNGNMACATLQQAIAYEHAHRRETWVAFLDLSQAYDSVSHSAMFKIMERMGFVGNFLNLLQGCYSSATFTVHTAAGYTQTVPYTRGLRQGCPLSPTLFNIYFSIAAAWLDRHCSGTGIDLRMRGLKLRHIFYADDVALVAGNREHLQQLVKRFEEVCDKLHLSLNPKRGKSAVVVFHRHRRNADQPAFVNTHKGPVHHESSYIYLGVKFTENCRWLDAYEHRSQEAKHSVDSVNKYVAAERVHHMEVAGNMFNSVVMPALLYGAPIWGWDIMQSADMLNDRKLQSYQGMVLKPALRLPKTASNIILCLESGMWPVYYYAVKAMLKFVHSVAECKNPIVRAMWLLGDSSPKYLSGKCLRLVNRIMPAPIDYIPTLSAFLDAVRTCMITQLQNCINDPQGEEVEERRLASYLSWVWNNDMHSRPKFYSMFLRDTVYYSALKLRLMISGLPVHVRRGPYNTRRCCCCNQEGMIGDYEHVFLHCTHFAAIRQRYMMAMHYPTCMRDLLCSREYATWEYMTSVAGTVAQRVFARQGRRQQE